MKMRTLIQMGAGVALGLTAVACGSSTHGLTTPTPPAFGSGAAGASSQDLLGSWQLLSLTETGQPTVSVPPSEVFMATFGDDRRVSLVADCNRCTGGYTAKSNTLTVGPMACTRAYCQSAPLDTTFAGLVSGATTWTSSGTGLELRCDAGVLRFQR